MKNLSSDAVYLPSLKVLNLDNNDISGFGTLWSMLRYSRNVEILKYDDNEYFFGLRDEVRTLYESILFRNMKSLKILNQSPAELGLKRFYESAYQIYLASGSMFSPSSQLLKQLQKKIDFCLKENQAIFKLESERTKFS